MSSHSRSRDLFDRRPSLLRDQHELVQETEGFCLKVGRKSLLRHSFRFTVVIVGL